MGSMHFGGAERVLVDVLNNIDYARYDVTLLLMYGGGTLLSQLPKEVCVVSAFKTADKAKWIELVMKISNSVYGLILDRAMRKAVGNRRFDIAVSFLEGTAARMHYILDNVADHNYSWVHCNFEQFKWYLNFMPCKMLNRFYSRLDGVAAISDVAADAFCRVVPTSAPVRTIYNVANLERIQSLGSDGAIRMGTKYEVCMVGRLIPVKGHILAIDAIKLLRDRGIDAGLRIVGDGPVMAQVQAYAAQKFNPKNISTPHSASVDSPIVSFVGFSENPYKFIASCDVMLIASETEGLGMTAVEAMALGKTVVSTDIDGPRELLEGGYGYLCQRTSRAISEAIAISFCQPIDPDVARHRAADFSPKSILSKIYEFIDPENNM